MRGAERIAVRGYWRQMRLLRYEPPLCAHLGHSSTRSPAPKADFLTRASSHTPRRTVSGWAAFIDPPKHEPLGVSSVAFVDIEALVADWIDSAASAGKLSNPAS